MMPHTTLALRGTHTRTCRRPLAVCPQGKHYPREWLPLGRLRVQLKGEDGLPINPDVPNSELNLWPWGVACRACMHMHAIVHAQSKPCCAACGHAQGKLPERMCACACACGVLLGMGVCAVRIQAPLQSDCPRGRRVACMLPHTCHMPGPHACMTAGRILMIKLAELVQKHPTRGKRQGHQAVAQMVAGAPGPAPPPSAAAASGSGGAKTAASAKGAKGKKGKK